MIASYFYIAKVVVVTLAAVAFSLVAGSIIYCWWKAWGSLVKRKDNTPDNYKQHAHEYPACFIEDYEDQQDMIRAEKLVKELLAETKTGLMS